MGGGSSCDSEGGGPWSRICGVEIECNALNSWKDGMGSN